MSATRDSSTDREGERKTATDDSETPPVLRSTVVRYTDRPDERTVYPPGLTSIAKMSTWLTANDDAFVDQERLR
jgi:hypothetical protein